MDLLWIASLKLIIFTDIRTIKGLKTKMSGFDVFSNMKKPELRLMRGSGFRYGQRTSNQGSGRVRQDSGCAEYEESADSNPCCHTR